METKLLKSPERPYHGHRRPRALWVASIRAVGRGTRRGVKRNFRCARIFHCWARSVAALALLLAQLRRATSSPLLVRIPAALFAAIGAVWFGLRLAS